MYLTTLIRSEEPDIQKIVDAMLKKIQLRMKLILVMLLYYHRQQSEPLQ